MTKYYEKSVTRQHNKAWLHAWIDAEAQLGLKNSFFLIDNGMVTQYVDGEESERFHEFVKKITEDDETRTNFK